MKNQLLWMALLLAAGSTLRAQQNLYVATSGNDSNTCTSVSQPCHTFQGAMNKGAFLGTIVALDGGDFGPVAITVPVVLDGGAHGAFISAGSQSAIHVALGPGAGGPVIIRNLSIVFSDSNSGPYGVFANLQSGSLTLDHVAISATEDLLSGVAYGININAPQFVPIRLKDVTLSGVQTGISIYGGSSSGPTKATLENVSVDASQSGLSAIDVSVTIRNSSFVGPVAGGFGVALAAQNTSPVSTIESTQIANQATGLIVQGEIVRLSNCVITGNTTGVNSLSGGTIISYRNNTFAGNGTDGPISLSTSLK
jgi:hypothetical protein